MQADRSAADWGVAQQVGKGAGDRVVTSRAIGCQAHVLAAKNVVTMEVFNCGLTLDQQRFRSAGYVRREIHSAAPSPIFSAQQLGDLSELPVLPLHGQLHWGQPQAGSALPGCVDLEQPGIGEIKIRAHGRGLYASAPGILRILPKRHVGIHQRVGLLRLSQLEIDASTAGFEVGERRASLRSRFSGRSRGNLRVALEQARQVPAAFVVAYQVDAGLGCAQGGNLESPAEQGTEPDRGGNVLRADHRLRAKCRIVVDDESLKIKARPRQKMKTYVVERDPASESASDGRGNPVSQTVHAGP